MSISIIVVANVSAIILMICMFTSIYKGQDYVHSDVNALCLVGALTVVESVFEIISDSIDRISSLRWLNYFTSSGSFMLNVLIELGWIIFVYIKLYGSLSKVNKAHLVALVVPGAVVCILSMVNYFKPVFYTVSQDNHYQRTSFYIYSVVVAVFYMAYGFVIFEIKSKKNKRYTFYPTFSFLFPVLFFQIIQIIFNNNSLNTIGIAIGIVAMYLSVKNELSCIDSLSGVFTRQYFERFLASSCKKNRRSKSLAGIMIDIDKFKSINDTYGHLVGNDAIAQASNLLISAGKNLKINTNVFRYGGDEFIVLQWVSSEKELLKTVDELNRISREFNTSGEKPYNIEFSMGYGIYDRENSTPQAFVSTIDKEMYKSKQSKKQKANA